MEINTGKIVQVLGPVVDVEFDEGKLPLIKDALTVEVDGKKVVMEVAQLMGNRVVRCITLAASEGLAKDMVATVLKYLLAKAYLDVCSMFLAKLLTVAKK